MNIISSLKKVQDDLNSMQRDRYFMESVMSRIIYDYRKITKPVEEAFNEHGFTIITDSYSYEYGDHILIVENEDCLMRLRVHDTTDNKSISNGGRCFYNKSNNHLIDKDSLIRLIKAFDTNVDSVSVKDDGTVIIKTVTALPYDRTSDKSYSDILPEYLDKNCPNYVLDNKSDRKYTFKKCNSDDCIDEMKRSELPDKVFGIPEERKYPMPDKKHVYSAIKLFGHVEPKYEKELANNIKKKMKEYGISKDEVGEKNRLRKYL